MDLRKEKLESQKNQRFFAFFSKGIDFLTQSSLSRSPMTCTMASAQPSLPLPQCPFCTGLPRPWTLFFLPCWAFMLSLHLLVSTLLPSLFIVEYFRAQFLIIFPLLSFFGDYIQAHDFKYILYKPRNNPNVHHCQSKCRHWYMNSVEYYTAVK